MKIIIGLGNPGQKYLCTRHNLGFMLLDALSKDLNFQNSHNCHIQKILIENQRVILAKPQAFINLSGLPVRDLCAFYKTSIQTDLLVVQDDKDQDFGKMKFQKNRGHGGHNGIKDIHRILNTNSYTRLKLGTGIASKSSTKLKDTSLTSQLYNKFIKKQTTSEHVLSAFTKQEQEQLPEFLKKASQACHSFILKGYTLSSNQFNHNIT